MAFVLLNNVLVLAKDAKIPVSDRGFRYGDGVFETIRIHAGKPYQWPFHMQRLAEGLAALRIAFDTGVLQQQCTSLLQRNGVAEGLLRIQITRGGGGRGYLPDAQGAPNCVIETMDLPALPQEPISLWLSGYEKISPRALPVQYKLSQGLNSTLARMEAQEHSCFDALMLSAEKNICETSSGSIFWLKDDTLYTPALECGVLKGSMRAAIIRLCAPNVREVAAPLETLRQAQAVFICNAAWGALPVADIKNASMRWEPHPLIETLRQKLLDDLAG